jgi:hypothetical protein
MNTIDIISLAVLIIIAVIGYGLGFGKSVKIITGGIVGFIISLFVCVAFGGYFQGLAPIAKFIANINETTTGYWEFLKYLQLGYVAFYVILFAVVQVLRAIAVKTLVNITESNNKVVQIINKILGAALCLAFFGGIVLLAFAGIKLIEDTSFSQGILEKLNGSYLMVIYENNPIAFK